MKMRAEDGKLYAEITLRDVVEKNDVSDMPLLAEVKRLYDENAKLRECLQEFADAIKNDDGFGVDQGWMLERMRELGIEGD